MIGINESERKRNCVSLTSKTNQVVVDAGRISIDAGSTESCGSLLEQAKRLFHRSAVVPIVGRTPERLAIQRFWDAAVSKPESPRSLYICGVPGVGKSALLSEMLPQLTSDSKKYTAIHINCMMQSSRKSVVLELYSQLARTIKKPRGRPRKSDATPIQYNSPMDYVKSIFNMLESISDTFVIFLDEVDYLIDADSNLSEESTSPLYQVYALAEKLENIIIVGVANSLDLAVKYLDGLNVERLSFSPYTAEDVSRIIVERIRMANNLVVCGQGQENMDPSNLNHVHKDCFISPAAVELCARKASLVGDLRRALEVMRESICIAQRRIVSEGKGQMMASVNRQVQISDVLKSLEAHVDGFVSSSKSAQRICELNLHQKMFISCLRKIKIDSPNLKIPVSVLYGRYASTAINLKILEAVGRSEFIDLLVNAESMGVISLSGGPLGHGSSSGYRRKNAILNEPVVCLTVSPDDVALALKDTSIIL